MMRRRGRPAAPGLLTPREEEVLELLRAGLTNREIAGRLGISLQGAKYHVTEILSKLGVSSRKDAAKWKAHVERRWVFIPTPALGTLREGFASFITPKLAGAAIAVVLVVGSGAAILGSTRGDTPGLGAAAGATTPTPELPEICQDQDCQVVEIIRSELSSLDEAMELATFEPRFPSYLPPGFERRGLIHSGPDYPPERRSRSDTLTATYVDGSGERLVLIQGWQSVAPISWLEAAPTEWLRLAPEGMHGTVPIGDGEAFWVKGGPRPITGLDENRRPIFGGWDDGGYILYWSVLVGETGAWEVSPDGELRTGLGPEFAYAVGSTSLPLDELVKVAESLVAD